MLTKYEKETIINYNDESKKATIYTCNQALQNKLLKLCKDCPDDYKIISEDESSKTFETQKNLISFSKRRLLTEEQKEKLRNRLEKARFYEVD